MGIRRLLPRLVRSSVVVHTRDGRSFSGVLTGVHRDCVALAHARLLMESGHSDPLAGDLVIPRGALAFLQVDPAPTQPPSEGRPLAGLLG